MHTMNMDFCDMNHSFSQFFSSLRRFCVFLCVGMCLMPLQISFAFWSWFTQKDQTIRADRIPLVSILVEESLLENIKLKNLIDQYALHVQNAVKGQSVLVGVPKDASVKDVFEGNAHLYFSGFENEEKTELIGTVLIGDVPLPIVQKGESLYPSVYPYVDFVSPSFLWNEASNRFVFESGGDEQAEIWHGVIRSDRHNESRNQSNQKTIQEDREKDLVSYFTQNARVHRGEVSFANQFFWMNQPLQKEALSDSLRQKYNTYLETLEDRLYARYSKHWLHQMHKKESEKKTLPWTLLSSSVKPENEINTQSLTESVIDVVTKPMIDLYAHSYREAWKPWIAGQQKNIDMASRWDETQTKTTIDFVAQKDALSGAFLKGINDTLTQELVYLLQEYNGATSLGVPKIKDSFFTGTLDGEGDVLFWNGVDRSEMTSEDCSLLRGNPRTEKNLFAQMAYDGDEFFNAAQGSSGCETVFTRVNEDEQRVHRFDSLMVHDEPRPETIAQHLDALTLSNIPIDDPHGVSFYNHGAEFRRFDMINFFDYLDDITFPFDEEKRTALLSRIENDITQYTQLLNDFLESGNQINQDRLNADMPSQWPVDVCMPQGAWGCYDGGGFPLSLNDCRSYSKTVSNPDVFTTRIEWNETCEWNTAGNPLQTETKTEKVVRFYETGNLIPQNALLQTLQELNIDRIIDVLVWLRTDIETKNNLVFEQIFSSQSEAQSFFFDSSLNGFEGVDLVLQSFPTHGNAPLVYDMSFEVGDFEDGDYQFIRSQSRMREAFETPIAFLGVSASQMFPEKKRESDGAVRVYTDEETGEQEVLLPENKNDFLDTPLVIRLQPEALIVGSTDIDAIQIEATLYNRANRVVKTDFETELTLSLPHQLSRKWFRVIPEATQTVSSGRATWYLLPQDIQKSRLDSVVEVFSNTNMIANIPLRVYDSNIDIYWNDDTPIAGNKDGIRFEGRILNEEGKKTNQYDGELVTVRADGGRFENTEFVIENGVFEGLWYPSTQAKDVSFVFESVSDVLPIKETMVSVIPDEPVELLWKESPNSLILGEDWVSSSVILVDQYKNEIDDVVHFLVWNIENGIFEGAEEASEKSLFGVTGEGSVRIKGTAGGEATLSVRSGMTDAVLTKEIEVIERPVLRGFMRETEIKVGKDTPTFIEIEAQTAEGDVLNRDIQVEILLSDPDMGTIEKRVLLENGAGKIPFFPGTKAGVVSFEFVSAGFESRPLFLKITPDEPHHIEMGFSEKVLKAQAQQNAFVEVQVSDRYGNRVDSFQGNGVLAFNEPHIVVDDVDEDLSLTLEQEQYIEQENRIPESVSQPNDPQLLQFPDGRTFRFRNGTARIRVQSSDRSGEVYMTAKTKDVHPGILHFSVVRGLEQETINTFTGKSLLTILGGIHGGFVPQKRSFGNQIVLSGENQAVGVSVSDPQNKAQKGFLTPQGVVSDNVSVRLVSDEFFTLSVHQEKQQLASVRFLFAPKGETVSFRPVRSISEWKQQPSGIYFLPHNDEGVVLENQTFLHNGKKLFTITKNGGVRVENVDISFQLSSAQNIHQWDVFLHDRLLGKLLVKPYGEKGYRIVQNFYSVSESGVYVRSDSMRIRTEFGYTGYTTHDDVGILWVDREEVADEINQLGFSTYSIENWGEDERGGWNTPFRPFVHLSSGNTIGESTRIGSSPAFLLFGDPTLRIRNDDDQENEGITSDIGRILWRSRAGDIDHLAFGDMNGDGLLDLFFQVENQIWVSYADSFSKGSYHTPLPVFRSSQEIKSFGVFDAAQDGFWDMMFLDEKGELQTYKNTQGRWKREEKNTFFQSINKGLDLPLFERFRIDFVGEDSMLDIIAFDENQCLWYANGGVSGFVNFDQQDCLAPTTKITEEIYRVSDYQGILNRTFPKEEFSVLSQTFFAFSDRDVTTDDTLYLTTYGIEDAVGHHPLSFHPELDSKILITPLASTTMSEKGTLFDVRLEIQSFNDPPLSGHVILPDIEGFQFESGSESCEGCSSFEVRERTPVGSRWITFETENTQSVVFVWRMSVDRLPSKGWHFEDVLSETGKKEVVFPWEGSDQTSQLRVYWEKDGALIRSFLDIENIEDTNESDFVGNRSEADIKAEITQPLKADSDGDGYPDIYEEGGMIPKIVFEEGNIGSVLQSLSNDITEKKKEKVCESAMPNAVSSLPKTFFAPGSDIVYAPPFSFPGTFHMGTASFWLPTPPVSPTSQTSNFRLYIMPTTTGKVGIAGCSGEYFSSLIPPKWSPNCFASVPSGIGQICHEKEVNVSDVQSQNIMAGFSKEDRKTSLNPTPTKPNRQIKGADIVSQFFQEQFREYSNMKFESTTIKKPKIQSGTDTSEINTASESSVPVAVQYEDPQSWMRRLFASTFTQTNAPQENTNQEELNEKNVDQELAESPFANVQEDTVTIAYPKVTESQRAAYQESYTQYKESYFEWKEKMESDRFALESRIAKAEEENNVSFDFLGAMAELEKRKQQEAQEQQKFEKAQKDHKAVMSYAKGGVFLQELSETIDSAKESLLEQTRMMESYMMSYDDVLGDTLQNLESFQSSADKFMQSLDPIIEPFVKYPQKYPSAVSRGTLSDWLIRLFLSGISLPVKGVSVGGNQILDVSNSIPVLQAQIPKITTKPVELNVFSIPEKPQSHSIEEGNPWTFTQLWNWVSSLTSADREKVIDRDRLGSLTGDGSDENLNTKLQSLSAIQRDEVIDYAALASLMNVELEEKEGLPILPQFPIFDFKVPSILLPALETLEIPSLPDVSLQTVKDIVTLSSSVLDLVGAVNMGVSPVPEWYLRPHITQQANRETLGELDFQASALSSPPKRTEKPQETRTEKNTEPTSVLQTERSFVDQVSESFQCVVEKIKNSTKGLPMSRSCGVQGNEISFESGVSSSFYHDDWRKWTASTQDISQVPSALSIDRVSSFQEAQSNVEPRPKPYYYEESTGNLFLVNQLETEENVSIYHFDTNYDAVDEVFVVVGDTVYAQNPYWNELNDDTIYDDIRSAIRNDIVRMTWTEWQEKYVFARSVDIRFDPRGAEIQIHRFDDEVSYYEWVFTDRRDDIFDETKKTMGSSSVVRRIGMLVEPEMIDYDIRPQKANIVRVVGNPVGYMPALQDLQTYSPEECANTQVPKPFFSERSLIIGDAVSSRLEIRVPPREGRPEKRQGIVIKGNEETSVEYAEVCVTRGNVFVLERGKNERIDIQEGQYIMHGSQIHLDQNDEVELELFDGTRVVLRSNQRYDFFAFPPETQRIEQWVGVSAGVWYHSLTALKENVPSFWIPLGVLNPQLGDDRSPPRIRIKGGGEQTFMMGDSITIDASFTTDDDKIASVWWDLNESVDTDNDGDAVNDRDFVSRDEKPRDALTITLNPFDRVGEYVVRLWVRDSAGNESWESVRLKIESQP